MAAIPTQSPLASPHRPLGAPRSADQTEVGFVGRPVRAGRAGLGDTPAQAGPPRHDCRLVHELKREVSAATPPAPGSTRQNPRTGKQGAARARRRATASAPRTEPEPSTLPLLIAPRLLSAAHRSPAHHAPAVKSLRSSGAACRPSALSTRSLRTTRSRPGGWWRWQSPFPRPLTSPMHPLVPRRFRRTSTRGRPGSPRHATRRLAAARPLNCAALPTLLARAARRPSISPPTPTASRSARLALAHHRRRWRRLR